MTTLRCTECKHDFPEPEDENGSAPRQDESVVCPACGIAYMRMFYITLPDVPDEVMQLAVAQKTATDAIELLRKLCFDRGVILHATCCDDSREMFAEFCKRNNMKPPEDAGWTGGSVKVTPHA